MPILLWTALTAMMLTLGWFGLFGFWYTSLPVALIVYGLIAAMIAVCFK